VEKCFSYWNEEKFVQVVGVVYVAVFVLGFRCSSWGVQVGAFCEFLVSVDGVSLPTTSR
jgi:hypothetical protein